MLTTTAEFPFQGSRGFCLGSADPVTIIRLNDDGTAFVRRDPRPHEIRNRDASGNATLSLDELFATEGEAFDASVARKPKRSRPRKPQQRRK